LVDETTGIDNEESQYSDIADPDFEPADLSQVKQTRKPYRNEFGSSLKISGIIYYESELPTLNILITDIFERMVISKSKDLKILLEAMNSPD
jgi:hypothetical protein